MKKRRLVVGISGASGALIALELLSAMRGYSDWEVHLVITQAGQLTLMHELNKSPKELSAMVERLYDQRDMAAAISSGSFSTEGMVVVPCSMKTAAGIATGYSDNLLLRAADVTLKEQRKLVLVARETPLSRIHLRNLLTLSEAGAVILPPIITCYNDADSVIHMVRHIVGKILDCYGLDYEHYRRWS